MKSIIIHSFKGGAGKTTIAVNLAELLSKNAKVLLIETDFKMPSFNNIFQITKPPGHLNDFFSSTKKIFLKDLLIKINKNLDIITTNSKVNPADPVHSWDKKWHALHLKRFKLEINKLSSAYDYILFDTPPGLHFVLLNNLALSNQAFVVVRPNSMAVDGTKTMINNWYFKTKSPNQLSVYLIFNQIPRVKLMKTELDQWTNEFKEIQVKQGARVPCSCEGVYDMARGINIFPEDHELNRYLLPILSIIRDEPVVTIPDPTDVFT